MGHEVWCHVVAHHKRNVYTKILCSRSSLFCETHTHWNLHHFFILFGFWWAWKVFYHVFVNVNIVMFWNFCHFVQFSTIFCWFPHFFGSFMPFFNEISTTFFLSFVICECNQMKVCNIPNGRTLCIAIVVSQFCV